MEYFYYVQWQFKEPLEDIGAGPFHTALSTSQNFAELAANYEYGQLSMLHIECYESYEEAEQKEKHMAQESWKAPGLKNFLEDLAGRSTSIATNICVKPPMGCGGPATEFKDALSAKEYTISGLCQECQDKFFE